MRLLKFAAVFVLLLSVIKMPFAQAVAPPAPNPQGGSVGVEGRIGGAAPTQPATISIPANSQHFSSIPVTVSGSCPKGLLIEIFDNNVFVGSVICANGSYSIQIDLFDGQNDLVARDYDALNQAGPDSNTVTVFFNNAQNVSGPRPTLSTAYARRGADPGTTLSWPMTLSGGTGPYAISIDWGDNSPPDLISRSSAGDFTIQHIYSQSGVYKITVKAVDSTGAAAFLQLTAISNGPIQQTGSPSGTTTKIVKSIVWWPLIAMFVLTILAFWLGQKHQLQTIRNRLRRGERPI